MGGALSQYGTAVHLALLTVAPLFLSAFCGPVPHAVSLLGLAIFAAMWVVMNPAPREGEWPRDARHRIGLELAKDPFLYVGVIALVLSAIRAINGGVSIEYDTAKGLWLMEGAFVPLLPGSVSVQGVLPLAGLPGVMVVTLGVRHALGSRGRFAFLFSTGILAAAAVAFWQMRVAKGMAVPRLTFLSADPFSLGSLLGVFFLFSLVAWIVSWMYEHTVLELVCALAAAVLLAGMILYSSVPHLYLFGTLAVTVVALGVILSLFRRTLKHWLRSVIFFVIILSPVAFSVAGALPRPTLWPVFADGFAELRETASALAIRAWRESSQLGVGLGAYPLARDFFATADDWTVLPVTQVAAPNGWIHFLFERGFLGCAVLLAGLGVLVRDIVLKYVRAGSGWQFALPHFLGPIVFVGVVAILFVDCSYVQLEALMPVAAALSVTAAALPDSAGGRHG